MAHISIHSRHPPKPTSVRFTELFIKEELVTDFLVQPTLAILLLRNEFLEGSLVESNAHRS